MAIAQLRNRFVGAEAGRKGSTIRIARISSLISVIQRVAMEHCLAGEVARNAYEPSLLCPVHRDGIAPLVHLHHAVAAKVFDRNHLEGVGVDVEWMRFVGRAFRSIVWPIVSILG